MKDSEASTVHVSLKGSVRGESIELAWDAQREPSNPDFAFLKKIIDTASSDKGLMLPTAGSEALRDLAVALANNAADLVKTGRFTLQAGDIEGAKRIAEEALQRDPNSVEAQSLLDAAIEKGEIRQQKADAASLPRKFRFIQVSATEDIFGDGSSDTAETPEPATTLQRKPLR